MLHYLFDMDGVLVCSAPVTIRAALEVLSEYGITAKREDFTPFIGAGEAQFVGGVAEQYGVAYTPEMKDKTYEKYMVYAREGLQIYPNAKKVLELLKARGDRVALCSSADFIKIQANMAAADIPLATFDAIVSGNDTERKKPHPDIFLAAACQLGVAPSDCLVIEDAVNGIQAAKRAGMRCAAVTTSFSRARLTGEQPDFILDDLMDILSLPLG